MSETISPQTQTAPRESASLRERSALRRLQEISVELLSRLELDPLLKSIVTAVADLLEADFGEVYRYNPADHDLHSWVPLRLPEKAVELVVKPGDGVAGKVLLTGQPVKVDDYDSWQGKSSNIPRGILGPVIQVPIRHGQEFLGVLAADRRPGRKPFTDEDVELLQLFASQAAVAIANARLYEAALRQQNALKRLQEMSVEILRQLELVPLLESILQGVVDLLEADSGNFYRYDAQRAELHLWVPVGFPEEVAGLVLRRGEGGAGKVLATGRPVKVDDYDSWEGRAPQWPRGVTGPLIQVPVRHGAEFLGVLSAVRRPGRPPFTDQDVELLQLFATQVSVAIANARLYEQTRRNAEELSTLYDTSLELTSQLDLQKVLEAIGLRAWRLLQAKVAEIVLYDQATGALREAVRVSRGEIRPPSDFLTKPGKGIDGQVYASGEALIIEDYNLWEGRLPHVSPLKAPRMAVVPIRHGEQKLGTLKVRRMIEDPPFTEEDMRLLTLFANQAAVALANAQQYQELQQLYVQVKEKERLESELRVAHNIQSSLLPQELPKIRGWEVAAFWTAARVISGDFYDVFPVPGGRWGFVIADVAGKGVAAALFMALCRTLVRTFCIDGRPPREAIARANDLILADARTDWFVTLFYGLLDPKWGILTYVNAGHQPPLWYRRDLQHTEGLKAEGMALGVFPGVALQERSLQMGPGDVVLFYTDGLSEAADPHDRFFGERRLRTLLREMANEHPSTQLARLRKEIAAFTRGREPSDDLTAILLKRTDRGG